MKKLLGLILPACLIGCKAETSNKILDLGSFSISVPTTWQHLKQNGIDSYVGLIVIDNHDTLSFDKGWYSNNLYEAPPFLIDSSNYGKVDTTFVDPSSAIYVKDEIGIDRDRYRKNNIAWETVDSCRAKIVFPITSGLGTTGIYIDTLFVKNGYVTKFNLYGENLSPENEKAVLKAIRTLKFKKP